MRVKFIKNVKGEKSVTMYSPFMHTAANCLAHVKQLKETNKAIKYKRYTDFEIVGFIFK